MIGLGFAPLCPHLFHHLDPVGNISHEMWTKVNLPWVMVSDAVLRLPGESVDADTVIEQAVILGIPVFGSIPDLSEFFSENVAA